MPHGSRYLYALAILFIVIAASHSAIKIARGGAIVEAVLDFVLIGLPAVLILHMRNWLSAEFDPALYRRVALWGLGGVAVMLGFLTLRAIHPGVTVRWTFTTRAIALSMGSIAGLAIGIHEAQALTREQKISQQNEELKRTKQALEERNDELKHTQSKLERTVKEVEASNDRLEQFAYAASHDLREPIRMVSNYLELLDDRYGDELDDDASEFVEFARDGAARMQTLVEDLLQFSQVETQREPLEPVDLEAVVDEACADLQVSIEERDAEITRDELPRVQGDPSQLRQLFQNLLSNAIEYSEDTPRIHISVESRGDTYAISVADEGIGIESAEQERIFEIFERLHSSADHTGTGIGLALCQRIVERHGGDIWVESEPGEGATFSFTLTIASEHTILPEDEPTA